MPETADDARVRLSDLLGPDFRDLGRPDGVLPRNVAYLTGVWATVGAALALVRWRRNPLTVAVAFVVISARQQALLNVEHECTHHLFAPGRRELNDRVGSLLTAAPVGSPYFTASAHHLAHHRTLASPEDPDRDLYAGAGKDTRAGLVKHFLRGISGAYALWALTGRGDGADGGDPTIARRDLRSIAGAQAVVATGVTAVAGWWAYPVLWLGPLGTLTSFSHLLRSWGEHALTPAEEAEHGNRLITTRSNPVERWLVAPYDMNQHSEHHLAPWVPAHRLPEVQRRLEASAATPPRLVRRGYLVNLLAHLRAL